MATMQQSVIAPPPAVLIDGVTRSASYPSQTWANATHEALDRIARADDSPEPDVLPRPQPAHLAPDSTGKNESWRIACCMTTAARLAKGKAQEAANSDLVRSKPKLASAWEGPFSVATDTIRLSSTVESKPKDDQRLGYSVVRLHSVQLNSALPGSIWLGDGGEDFDFGFEDTCGRVRVKLERPLKLTGGWEATDAWIDLNSSLNWSRTAQAPLIAEEVMVTLYASAPRSSAPRSGEASHAGPSIASTSSDGSTFVHVLCRRALLTSNIRRRIGAGLKTRRMKTKPLNVILSLEDRGPAGPASGSLLTRQWENTTVGGTVELRPRYLVPRTDVSISGQRIAAIVLDGWKPSRISLKGWTTTMEGEYTVSVITKDGDQ